ncbi:hypothetical protein [Helicobacter sp. MIT 05-5294]|uniref:hypothetical protein n=1 Tax=Helicobacter sp. MIT 05-5294 TaxID=1548150 RepID=UPI00051FDF5A|nr:hypothetical protein [Helicobacter sp. MIT 05-5294]TLD85422.1 hypothetical protein LS69_009665 [Helicobacter sp. MIT 05-5294]
MCSKKQISSAFVVIFMPSVIALLAILIEYIISPPNIDCIPFGRLVPESLVTFLIVIMAFIAVCVYGMIILYHLLLLIAVFKKRRYGNNLIAIIKHIMFCIVTLVALFIVLMWNPNEPPPCDCEKVDCDCVLQHSYRIDGCYFKDNNE